jgi:hypothetical protein
MSQRSRKELERDLDNAYKRLATAEAMIEQLKESLKQAAKGPPSGYMSKGYWYEYPKD